jgi:hypothetical protein
VAISALDRAVAKGVLHRNNAARRKSRLMKRLIASGQAPATPAPAPAAPQARKSRSSAPADTAQPAKGTRSKAASKR